VKARTGRPFFGGMQLGKGFFVGALSI